MKEKDSILDRIVISNPCKAKWQEMPGTDKVRFCDKCQLNVYNLSEMNKKEAEELIVKTEGKICGRFYRREDGTILTKDCPASREATKQKISSFVKNAILTLISFTTGLSLYNFVSTKKIDSPKPSNIANTIESKDLIQLNRTRNKEQCKLVGPEEGGISVLYIEPKKDPFRDASKHKPSHK
jgi:hypothetical protein